MSASLRQCRAWTRGVALPVLFLLLLLIVVAFRPPRALATEPAAAPAPPPAQFFLPIAANFQITQPIATGWNHSCAILPTGVVRCWGANSRGQLGDGTATDSVRPVTVTGLPAAIAIAAFGTSTCAATVAGVWCWGYVDHAGMSPPYGLQPVHIEGVSTAIQLLMTALQNEQHCALAPDGRPTCWVPGETAAAVDGVEGADALATLTRCAILATGMVRCWSDWGWASSEWDGAWTWPGVEHVRSLASDSWATNSYKGAVLVLCFAAEDGNVACWKGDWGFPGFLGTYPAAPDIDVPGAVGAVQVTVQDGSVYALLEDGRIWCTETFMAYRPAPCPPGSSAPGALEIPAVDALSAGDRHVCAHARDGAVWCWGSNASGQLGDGTTTDSERPVLVQGLQF